MTDETTARIRAEVAGVAREMVESWEGEMTALDKLIEAVEAGEIAGGVSGLKEFEKFSLPVFERLVSNVLFRAYNGSLDAALALHEALLPGWDWHCGHADRSGAAVKEHGCEVQAFGANALTPARAWLLAILRAYRQQEGEQ